MRITFSNLKGLQHNQNEVWLFTIILSKYDKPYSKSPLGLPALSDPFREVVSLRSWNICMSDRLGQK